MSQASGGPTAANASSTAVVMTPDGRWVLYGSQASNLVAGQVDPGSSFDVFLFDRQSGSSILVSRAAGLATTAANGNSVARGLSADGRFVVFQSLATDLVAGVTDTNAAGDVYLFDRQGGMNRLISHVDGSPLQAGNNSSTAFNEVAIDESGSVVVFQTLATDLFAGTTDGNNREDLVVFDIASGMRTLVSRSAANPGTTANNQSLPMQVSASGSHILFTSSASDLVSGVTDDNATFDAFLYERGSGMTTLLTTAAGNPAEAASGQMNNAVMSADLRWLVVNTRGNNMVAGQVDSVGTDDLFLIDRQTGSRRLLTGVNGSLTQAMGAVATMSRRQISGDGRFIVISTQGTNLLPGVTDTNAANDLYLFDRVAGTTVLLSAAAGSPTTTANALTGMARLSADGQWLLFASNASNLMAGVSDTNGGGDAFLMDTATRRVRLVSGMHGSATVTGNGVTSSVMASADGSSLLLQTSATDLVITATDTNLGTDVVLTQVDWRLFVDGFE